MNITTLFGTNAVLNTTAPANPQLELEFLDLATAAQWDTAPTTDTGTGSKWFLAIIRKVKAAVDAITDNSNTVTVGAPTISVQTINNQLYDVYTYSVGFRIPRSGGSVPDPDNI